MAASQAAVVALLLVQGHFIHAAVVGVLLAAQMACMVRFLRDPVSRAVWYSAIGVGLYVSGMMVTAFALRPVI
jgi:chlorophyll synthase